MKALAHKSLSTGLVVLLLMTPFIAFAQGIKNPLKINTILELVVRVTQFLLGLVGALALLALVWGGIKIITSLGNEEGVRKGKQIITWAVIGLVVVFGAFLVITSLQGVLGIG